MGGLLHLFEFNQRSMARKIHSQKHLVDGLEAPRNSLEFPPETSQSYYAIGDSLPYYQVKEVLPPERNHYPTKVSMKKLTRDEVSKRPNTGQNSPNIVARLMGIETMPLDSKPVIQPIEKKNKRQILEHAERCSTFHVPSKSLHRKHMDSDQDGKERYHGQRHNMLKSGKPRPREHPQEKELQKFKKDFEAWQAARVRECSRVLEGGSISQEKLNKEMVEPSRTSRTIASEKLVKPRDHHEKSCLQQMGGLPNHGLNNDLLLVDQRELLPSRSRTLNRDFEQVSAMNSGKMDKSFIPSKIVILKPGPDGFDNYEEPYISGSEILEERVSIEDFLDEVKARLKYEMQGKALRRGKMVRGGGIETPFTEKPSDPKQIARHIAKQVRESVTRGLDMNLLRLESTRSYRSEIQFDETGSPEFINRDSRRVLSQRLRNILKKEADLDIPAAVVGSSRVSIHEDESHRLGQTGHTSKTRPDMQTGCFRHRQDDGLLQEFYPRNLIRSLSAPVPGASFGKLLLEDRHILTGAHIRRKQEAGEIVSVDLKNQKKDKFKFREKVSNLRYSFTLKGKGRLFNRKIQSAQDSHSSERDFMNDIVSGPTVVLSSCDSLSSTELPPSPASVCSSVLEEIWPVCSTADHLSQISTPDLATIEDHNIPLIFREISSNLDELLDDLKIRNTLSYGYNSIQLAHGLSLITYQPLVFASMKDLKGRDTLFLLYVQHTKGGYLKLRKQLNQLESDGSEEAALREDPLKAEIVELDLGDQAKSYVRDLLMASGLYIKSSDQMLSRWNALPFPKPISMDIYEEVEESHRRLTEEKGHSNACDDLKHLDHKVLHDLLNEALLTVLGPPMRMSGFLRQAVSPPPCGRRLLDRVWEIMSVHLYPSTDSSTFLMDGMVEQDLGSTLSWTSTKDEVHAVGIDMEYLVIGDLIEEIVKEMEP